MFKANIAGKQRMRPLWKRSHFGAEEGGQPRAEGCPGLIYNQVSFRLARLSGAMRGAPATGNRLRHMVVNKAKHLYAGLPLPEC